jgi:hypothetical protein
MPLHKPQQQSAEQLRAVAVEMVAQGNALIALAKSMEDAHLPELKVNNYDQLRRAAEYVVNYSQAAQKALRKAREERGDFGVPTKNGAVKKHPRT